MTIISTGLLIWVLVHLFPSVFSNQRQKLISLIGSKPYQGLFSILIIVGLVLIVSGWRNTVPAQVYLPVEQLRLPSVLLAVAGLMLVVAAKFPATRLKFIFRHPQLTGVMAWSIAHLLMNGDSRSLLVFSVIGLWCIVLMFTINRRDGEWRKPEQVAGWGQELVMLMIGLIVAATVIYFHQYLSGIAISG
ncbi:MAG: NnrU protein [Gammaproteobacteria bacterium]|nr:NnrU protein [Gammaproteobacteria bacterium]